MADAPTSAGRARSAPAGTGQVRPPMGGDRVAAVASGDLRLRSLATATPLLAWALVAAFGLLGLAYAIAVPLLHAPDEGAHVDRVATFDLAGQFTVDPTEDLRYSPDLLAAYAEVGIVPVDHRVLPRLPWTPLNTLDVAEQTGRTVRERPPWPRLAPYGRSDERFVNAARSHPPGHYAVVDGLDAVATALGAPALDEASWGASVARWRAWSTLLHLPIPWAAFWIAARLARTTASPRRPGLAAAALTLAVPQLSHSAGSVNNDALLFAGTALCALACTWIATGDRSGAAAAWSGVGAGVASFAKVFGAAAPTWIAVAVVVGARGAGTWSTAADRSALRGMATRLAVAAGTTLLAGGAWVVGTVLAYGTIAPRGFGYAQPDDLDASPLTWLREVAERLPSTGFGRLGIEQFGIPGWSVWLATGLLVGLVGAALAAPALRGRRGVAVVLLAPFATTLAMVLVAAWGGYARSGVPSGLHGRYLFVAAAPLAALAAVGLGRVPVAGRRALPAALGLAVLFQGLGLATALASWWPGGWTDRVRTATLFSGWADPALALLALATVATAAMLAVGLRREAAAP